MPIEFTQMQQPAESLNSTLFVLLIKYDGAEFGFRFC